MIVALILALLIPTGNFDYYKVTTPQRIGSAWTRLDYGDIDTLTTDKRALFFAHVRVTCTKKPRYVKLRFVRYGVDGRDTTGTNTWVLGAASPKKWTISHSWTINTRDPVGVEVKIVGGNCVSTERQLKAWVP